MGGGYYPEINKARGITVLFVLLGHSFPDLGTGITDPVAAWIFSTIYSFHMGAFFFYSGFVSARKLCGGKCDLSYEIKKKLWRLGVPYLVFSFASLLIKVFLPAFASEEYAAGDFWKVLIGISPNGVMWFLWTLLVISVVFLAMNVALKDSDRKEWIYLAVGIAAHVLYYILPTSFFSEVLRFTLFYSFGIVANRHYEQMERLVYEKKYVGVFALVLFIAGNVIDGIPYFITCPLAIIVIMDVSRRITGGAIKKFLDEMGTYSYDLYLISYFVQRPLRYVIYSRLGFPYVAVVLLMFVLGTLVTYLVSRFILRKVKLFEYVFLGKTWF